MAQQLLLPDPSLNPYAPPGAQQPTVARLRSGLSRVVAVLLVLGGLTGLHLQIALWRWVAAQIQLGNLSALDVLVVVANILIVLLYAAVSVAAIGGGLLLWRRRGRWRLLCAAALVPQLLMVVVPGFQYRFWMLCLVGFGFAGHRLGGFVQTGTQMSVEFEREGWAFLVNVPSALGLLALFVTRPRRSASETHG